MLVYRKYPAPHLRKAKTTRSSRQLEGEKMIMFHIYEQNTRTKENTLLDQIEAGNIVEARRFYIKKTNWEPRRHVKLVVRSPPLR
tara:strand:- start:284 stop:538 length:255 start_codon:yes stop_codon:yes gene_type:complete